MDLNLNHSLDSTKEGTKEVAETVTPKMKELHEKYISECLPECAQYGDKSKFALEVLPGVTPGDSSEQIAIREGDWRKYAFLAGIEDAFDRAFADVEFDTIEKEAVIAKNEMQTAIREVAEAESKIRIEETNEIFLPSGLAEDTTKETPEIRFPGGLVKESEKQTKENAIKDLVEKGTEKIVEETGKIEKLFIR